MLSAANNCLVISMTNSTIEANSIDLDQILVTLLVVEAEAGL